MAFNKLTDAQAERLALLAEECGEVIQAIGKIMRHGYESHHPFIEGAGTNRQALQKELGDVTASVTMLCNANDLSQNAIFHSAGSKIANVKRWLHHQQDPVVPVAWCESCFALQPYHGDPNSIHLHLCDVCNTVVRDV